MVTVCESDMAFGPFKEEAFFHIEKAPQYTEKLINSGVKTCEFILRRGGKIYFIEAKKTCPNRENPESKGKLAEYVSDIAQKMYDSLNLYAAVLLKKHSQEGMPVNLCLSDLSGLDICLVLVVKNAEPEWLKDYPYIFSKSLRKEMRIWKIPDFAVLTEEQAKEKGLVITDSIT